MGRMMSEHQTVLQLVDVTDDNVGFTNHEGPDVPDQDRTPQTLVVLVSKETWRDLGDPETITVSVKPGDHLNVNPESERT